MTTARYQCPGTSSERDLDLPPAHLQYGGKVSSLPLDKFRATRHEPLRLCPSTRFEHHGRDQVTTHKRRMRSKQGLPKNIFLVVGWENVGMEA